jgi:hypothetical protein
MSGRVRSRTRAFVGLPLEPGEPLAAVPGHAHGKAGLAEIRGQHLGEAAIILDQ